MINAWCSALVTDESWGKVVDPSRLKQKSGVRGYVLKEDHLLRKWTKGVTIGINY